MKNLAVIPARGGSKRIPRKNINLFLGKPIIQYSIEIAKSFNFFDEIMISTDDIEISELAVSLDAKVPFKRSEKNSDDYSTLSDVLLEVLTEYQNRNIFFDNVCIILPTSPLITPVLLNEAYQKLVNNNFSAIIPLVRYQHPIQRAFKIDGNSDTVKMLQPENYMLRTQDCESSFYDSGQFYWINVRDFFKHKTILMDNISSIELTASQCHDIDDVADWNIAENKYKLLKVNSINKS